MSCRLERMKTILITNGINLHVENPKEFTKLINKFSMVAGYKIIIKKSQLYFYVVAILHIKKLNLKKLRN